MLEGAPASSAQDRASKKKDGADAAPASTAAPGGTEPAAAESAAAASTDAGNGGLTLIADYDSDLDEAPDDDSVPPAEGDGGGLDEGLEINVQQSEEEAAKMLQDASDARAKELHQQAMEINARMDPKGHAKMLKEAEKKRKRQAQEAAKAAKAQAQELIRAAAAAKKLAKWQASNAGSAAT